MGAFGQVDRGQSGIYGYEDEEPVDRFRIRGVPGFRRTIQIGMSPPIEVVVFIST